MLVWRFFRWLEGYIEYGNLPYTCQQCELLGLCRRPRKEGWKCYNGCMLINMELEEKYEGLPKGCWRCKYLEECRRPKEEGWQCYDGCRVIKERDSKIKHRKEANTKRHK